MARKEPDLHVISALLHTARQTLREQIAGERGAHKRGLEVIPIAVDEARVLVTNQGLTGDEVRAWRASLAA